MIDTIIAETFNQNKKVEYIKFLPRVGEYGVFLNNNKIYRAVASSGSGMTYKLTLERKEANERIVLKAGTPEIKNMKRLVKPTGFIKL